MKGLILCAGKGTRLYPITINHPKTLIPVANIPILQSCIEKLLHQGVVEIGIVIHPSQEAKIGEKFGNGDSCGAIITYIHQTEALGLSDAVRRAQDYIGQDDFLLLLGDNLIMESLEELKKDIEERGSHGSILLAEVKNPREYGIAQVLDGRIVKLVEKPHYPPSNLAVLGAYAFKRSIFKAISLIKPSARGELEITDAIQWLIDNGLPVTYHVTEKENIDVGTLGRWLEANRRGLDQLEGGSSIHESVQLDNCIVIQPISIDKGCVLKNCTIGPYVSISADVIAEDCKIQNSIILNGVHLKHISYELKDTVIGFNSVLAGLDSSGNGLKL